MGVGKEPLNYTPVEHQQNTHTHTVSEWSSIGNMLDDQQKKESTFYGAEKEGTRAHMH